NYGFSRDEFLAMTIEEIRPADELPWPWAAIESPGTPDWQRLNLAGIWRHRRKDGTFLEVEVTSQAHTFDDRPARVVLAVDLTERLRADHALRRSEARYRDLFENATDLIATVDLESRFTAVNGAFTRTLGYTQEELIGRPLSQFVPAEWHEQLGL